MTTTDTPNTGDRGMGGMAGDVNLFWNDHDDEHGTAEIEIMVAARVSRRKGIAREALRLMMSYAFYELGVKTFRAKIGFDNSASLALFRGLGYAEVSRSDMFREATMELSLTVADGAGEVVVAAAAAEGVEVEEGEKEGERFRSLLGEVWDSVVKGRYDE